MRSEHAPGVQKADVERTHGRCDEPKRHQSRELESQGRRESRQTEDHAAEHPHGQTQAKADGQRVSEESASNLRELRGLCAPTSISTATAPESWKAPVSKA